MNVSRTPDARPREAMRFMAAAAGVVAVLSGAVGASRDDPELVAVAVAFAALALYLYARWRDTVGSGAPGLLAAGVLGCAVAAVWLAVTGYRLFAVCLVVPMVFGALRFAGQGRRGT